MSESNQDYNLGREIGQLTNAIKTLTQNIEDQNVVIKELTTRIAVLENSKLTVSATFYGFCIAVAAGGGAIGAKIAALLGWFKPTH